MKTGKMALARRRRMMTPAGVAVQPRKPPPDAGAAPSEPAPKPKPLVPAKAKELA